MAKNLAKQRGNVWLDGSLTSPYKFYQFWVNTADVDAAKYIRIFTLLGKEQIDELEARHAQAPTYANYRRHWQKILQYVFILKMITILQLKPQNIIRQFGA